MRKIILGLICGALAPLSYADNCDKARNTYDDIYCTNKIYASADADLNKNYQQLRHQLNETQQKILKKSQLAWIRHRDAQCTDDHDPRKFYFPGHAGHCVDPLCQSFWL